MEAYRERDAMGRECWIERAIPIETPRVPEVTLEELEGEIR